MSRITRNTNNEEFVSYEEAVEFANAHTQETQSVWLPVDHGRGRYPQYEVIEAPKLGDLVSMGFNGDYYPEGEIVHISKTYHTIKTSTGKTFRRVKKTGSWKLPNGNPFCMVPGHRREWNREF